MIKMWLNSLNRCAILCVMCALSVCLAPCYAQSVLWSDGNEYVLSTIDQEVFDLPGEPGELTFSAKRTTLGLGSLYVDVWNSGAWQRMGQFSLGTSYQNYGPLLLPRTATRLRFCTEFGATLSKYITDIIVTKARYLDVDVPALFTLSNNEQQLTVRYADMGGDVVATCSDTHFQIVSPNDGCFHNFPDGSGTITVRFLPDTLGDYYAQLILTDGEYVTRIPLHGRYALADNEQEIIWNQRLDMLEVGDTLILDVISSSGLPVSVAVLENDGIFSLSTDTLVALAPGAGELLATQGGDNNYLPAPSVRTYVYVGVKSNCEELNNEELHWQVNANPIISECILYGPSVKIVKLYNLLGACVKSWNFNDETFPCLSFSGVTPGIYVLHMHGKAISGTLKVVVK